MTRPLKDTCDEIRAVMDRLGAAIVIPSAVSGAKAEDVAEELLASLLRIERGEYTLAEPCGDSVRYELTDAGRAALERGK